MDSKALDRFNAKYTTDEAGCWLWIGATTSDGYGTLSVSGRTAYSHRISYEHFVGAIPRGLQLDHLCRNRACVNPEHLEPVTVGENVRRGVSGGKRYGTDSHCRHGHPMTPENSYLPKGKRTPACRKCKRAAWYRCMNRPVPLEYAPVQ